MSYTPITDFLSLLRSTGAGQRTLSMPGLDYVVSAMARAGMFAVYVGQTPPLSRQSTTVWVRPSVPSWVAEADVFLWSLAAHAYQPATPALWRTFFSGGATTPYVFQAVSGATDTVDAGTTLLAVERAAPASTLLTLPSLIDQGLQSIKIIDWSTGVTDHHIFVSTPDGATIMKQNTWELVSTVSQLSGVTLYPSSDLNAWVIAP